MKALVKYANKPLCMEVREIDKPIPESEEVLIKVHACGICGTDLHVRHNQWICGTYPVVPGHEFCGEIAGMGDRVSNFQLGDLVVGQAHIATCGVCEYCKSGKRHICLSKKGIGLDTNGAFAEYVAVKADLVLKLPSGISSEEGALIEPLAIVSQGVLIEGRVRCKDRVAVIGPGPIGILSAQVSRAAGAKEVVVFGVPKDSKRLELCRTLGFKTAVIDDKATIETLESSFDFAVDASGNEKGIGLAINLLNKDKQLVIIGIPSEPMSSIPLLMAIKKALKILCSYSSSNVAWDEAISLVASQKIDLKPLITSCVSLDDWEKAFDDLDTGNGVKGIIKLTK